MRPAIAIWCAALALSLSSVAAQDQDTDGLTDAQETVLGTDPARAENVQVVIEDGVESEARRAAEGYDAGKDVVTVAIGHVGGDRYLWRVTFAGPPHLETTVFHLYLDADADESTGRKGDPGGAITGTDYMLTIVGGTASPTRFAADGSRLPAPSLSFVVDGNDLWLTADVAIVTAGDRARCAMFVLCHDRVAAGERPKMEDSTRKVLAEDIPLTGRDKILRPRDYTESHGVSGTWGYQQLCRILADPNTLQVRHDQLECDGFEVDLETSARFPHLVMRRSGARAWTKVPQAGRWHVGFMIYDDANDERYALRINDHLAAVVVANKDNYRYWLYTLTEPRELSTSDVVSVEAIGNSGKHGLMNLLFLPEQPPARDIEYEVRSTQAVAPVGAEGEAWLSWITTWPSVSTFEYGPTTAYGQTVEQDGVRLVHRAHLAGLAPDTTYHGRAVGTRPDGTRYYGPDITFTARGPQPPPTVAGLHDLPLTVANPLPEPLVGWPVTGGVPFPQAVLADSDHVRIVRDGVEVPAQIATTATWPDGSVKWILVTILVNLPAGDRAVYRLEYGADVKRAAAAAPMAGLIDGVVQVDTGAIAFAIDTHGRLAGLARGTDLYLGRRLNQQLLPGETGIETVLVASDGKTYRAALGSGEIAIEENGPLRTVVRATTPLTAEDGSTCFSIEQRYIAWRGRPYVRVEHTFTNTRPEEFTNIERLAWEVPIPRPAEWRAATVGGEALSLRGAVVQRLDGELVGPDGQPRPGRLVGSLVGDGDSYAVAVRNGWQQYPLGLAVRPEGVALELCPDFDGGFYDAYPFEKEGHQLFYYLRDGHYRFRSGMAKTHELFLCLAPEGERATLCAAFQTPPLLTPPPAWMCDSKAFYHVAPRDETRFAAYEAAIDKNLAAYIAQRERQHDYGLMNYGDWYGERGANWGNIEYDTQHAFLLEYIRSGNPEAFRLAHDTELHNRDVDTVHWAPDPRDIGAVYVHQMGHVGGYYTESVPGTLGIPKAGYTVSHAWAEGHFSHYFLTGDRRSLQTGRAVVDYFCGKILSRPYDPFDCRTSGWHLIMNAAALAATGDPYYLNASRVIVDRVLETQDIEPRELPDYQKEPGRTHQYGGWTRMMVPGHCTCVPRHRGEANFMVAVLLSGLTYYHDVTGEPAVKEAIIRGARWLIDDCYSAEVHGFRYTSCPNMRYTPGASPLMVEGIARAYRWTRDEIFKDCLTEALAIGAGGSSYGKGFSMYYRCAPRVLYDLAECGLTLAERATPPAVAYQPPDWLKALPPERLVLIQAEAFVAQGGGECEVRDDRQAVDGKMITKWHQDVGHYLEWTFTTPVAGRYRVVFRYATDSQATRRLVEIDGASVAESLAFPRTGGYGHSPADWQYLTLTDAAGTDQLLELQAGDHRLRMTNLGDGLGLDWVALVRVE